MTSEVKFVGDFIDNDSGDENTGGTKPKRKRQPNRVWLKIGEFDSAEEAEKKVISQNIWRKSSSKNTLDGHKVEYRCSAGKYRSNECPAGLYLLYHSTNNKVSIFSTESAHDNHYIDPARGLDHDTKIFVKKRFEEGIQKPNGILAVIRQKNMKEPSKSKLITYIQQLRYEKYGTPITKCVAEIPSTEISKEAAVEAVNIPCHDENIEVCNLCFMVNYDLKLLRSSDEIEMFHDSVKLCLPEIDLPKICIRLCTSCYEQMMTFYAFRKLCSDNYLNLKELCQIKTEMDCHENTENLSNVTSSFGDAVPSTSRGISSTNYTYNSALINKNIETFPVEVKSEPNEDSEEINESFANTYEQNFIAFKQEIEEFQEAPECIANIKTNNRDDEMNNIKEEMEDVPCEENQNLFLLSSCADSKNNKQETQERQHQDLSKYDDFIAQSAHIKEEPGLYTMTEINEEYSRYLQEPAQRISTNVYIGNSDKRKNDQLTTKHFCEICNILFNSVEDLRNHLHVHHKKKKASVNERVNT